MLPCGRILKVRVVGQTKLAGVCEEPGTDFTSVGLSVLRLSSRRVGCKGELVVAMSERGLRDVYHEGLVQNEPGEREATCWAGLIKRFIRTITHVYFAPTP